MSFDGTAVRFTFTRVIFLRRAHILHLVKTCTLCIFIDRTLNAATPHPAWRSGKRQPACFLYKHNAVLTLALLTPGLRLFDLHNESFEHIPGKKKTSSHNWLNLIVCTRLTRTTDVISSDKRHPRDVPYIRTELATTNEYQPYTRPATTRFDNTPSTAPSSWLCSSFACASPD